MRFLAIESSSAEARAKVSRSASLLRQAMTRCFRSGGVDGDCDGDEDEEGGDNEIGGLAGFRP